MLMPKPGNPCHFLTNIPRRFSAILFPPLLFLFLFLSQVQGLWKSIRFVIELNAFSSLSFFFPALFRYFIPLFSPSSSIYFTLARFVMRQGRACDVDRKRGETRRMRERDDSIGKGEKERKKGKKPGRNSNHGLNLRPGI